MVSRFSVFGVSLLGYFFALMTPKGLIELAIMASAGIMQLFPMTVVALWARRRLHGMAAIAGCLVGVAYVMCCEFGVFVHPLPGVHPGVIAITLNCLVFYLTHLICDVQRKEVPA
jgi:Na+/proline symporter